MNPYPLLINILSVPLTLYIIWIAIRNKDLRFLLQRLGLYYGNKQQSTAIWIHAASVGEVNAAKPVIQQLARNNTVLLTTNTPSSARYAVSILKMQVTHVYCPVDWKWAINKFIRTFRPGKLLIIETELWPNLFKQCRSSNIPITILNGRLSARTLNTSNWLKKNYTQCLQSTNAILTRNNEDRQRFIKLGASPVHTRTIGNIKFYRHSEHDNITAFKTIKPYVLAASTRNDEELLIASAWKKARHSEHLLIIVPRHPDRTPEIIKQLKSLEFNLAVRSKKDIITEKTDIYIADTFGELVSFIKGAVFVIMGGGFVNKGGQNILEVAHANKTVVFGPFMDNFREEAALFVDQQAGIQLDGIEKLPETINKLLNQPEVNEQYRKNAENLIAQQQTVLDNYLQALYKLYPDIQPA